MMDSDDPDLTWSTCEQDAFIATHVVELNEQNHPYCVSPETKLFLDDYVDISDVMQNSPEALSPLSPRTKTFLEDYVEDSKPNSPAFSPAYSDIYHNFNYKIDYITPFSSDFRPSYSTTLGKYEKL